MEDVLAFPIYDGHRYTLLYYTMLLHITILHITMSYDQHACNIIHVKISRYIEKEHKKDYYYYIFIKRKTKRKSTIHISMEFQNIVEIENRQERRTVPTKSTFNHQYYIQNFQFYYGRKSNP